MAAVAVAQQSGGAVRLVRPAVGCPTLDAAAKVAEAAILHDVASAREVIAAAGCEPFRALRGDIADSTDGAICVRPTGLSTCLWFDPRDVAPDVQSDEK